VTELIPEFIEAGFDVLNPAQTSAHGMDPRWLKKEFGRQIVFWGGGWTRSTRCPAGHRRKSTARSASGSTCSARAGGFVFNAIHNIQADTPTENMLAMFEATRDSAKA
jgi:hypothetical protein